VRGISKGYVFATAEDGLVGKIFFLLPERRRERKRGQRACVRRRAFPGEINRERERERGTAAPWKTVKRKNGTERKRERKRERERKRARTRANGAHTRV